MVKESWFQKEQLRLLLLVLPFVLLAIFWSDFPERFRISGNLWRKGEEFTYKYTLLVIPVLNVLLFGLFGVLNYREKLPAASHVWQVLAHLLLSYLFFVAGLAALGFQPTTEIIFKYALICLFLILGSYLGTLPRNATFGFRLPWTWQSNNIWRNTHRFAAKLWVYASLLMLIYPEWQHQQEWGFPLYIGLLGLLPILYSYVLYRKELRSSLPPNKKK